MKKQFAILSIVLLVGAACLLGFLRRSHDSRLTLTDVLARVEQADGYAYEMTLVATPPAGAASAGQSVRSRVQISPGRGMKIATRIGDANAGGVIARKMYQQSGKAHLTTLLPGSRQYVTADCDAEYGERLRREHEDPGQTLRQLLKSDYRQLDPTLLEGASAEAFQSTDSALLMGSPGERVEVTLWVDGQSRLPLRIEKTVHLADERQIQSVVADIDWTVVADANQYEPEIPADYKRIDAGPNATPKVDEHTALKGLKILSDLDGSFPVSLDQMTLLGALARYQQSDTPQAKKLREQMRMLTKEDRSKRMMEIAMPIQGLSGFYRELEAQGKEPAYYGQSVLPGEKDRLLMRWQVSAGVYRVVYGNLKVETIPADRLATLEARTPSK